MKISDLNKLNDLAKRAFVATTVPLPKAQADINAEFFTEAKRLIPLLVEWAFRADKDMDYYSGCKLER
jgi:hypothetical protein